MTKVKVCGMNNSENLKSLLTLPVDLVGFIFYADSKRNCTLSPNEVKAAFNKGNITAKKVGVFVDAPIEIVLEKHEAYALDYVQLHGNESIFYCQNLKEHKVNIIKAFQIDDHFSYSNTSAYSFFCDYFLFDAKGDLPGGNGIHFNWQSLSNYKGKIPFLLGGGIGQDDVEILNEIDVDQLRYVDINSSFETEPGYKNLDIVADFIYKIKRSDNFKRNRNYKKVVNG
jgi:phosphoribosylanthranilate isomerase